VRMNYQQNRGKCSYAEVRLLVIFATGFLLLALGFGLLKALDTNGDNLDDTWEAQYGITTNAYASTNLVGWWQLNGTNSTDNATDRAGNGINGTLSGFPSVAYGTGLFSNALYFTTNATVTFPTTNSVLNTTSQFTFSAWFRTTNSLSQPATIATWSDAATNGWSVGAATNGVVNITFFDGATDQVVAGTTNINLYDGSWHQLAATYTTNQVATVYVDGTGEATNTITGWTPGTVSSFTFGRTDPTATNNPYALDEARLYNRALGASEIPQLPITYSDLNGSGLTIFQDYLESLNPFLNGTIVTSGFISSGLTGYYGSSAPTLTKTGGDNQTVSANTFETNALVVHVTNGATALVGAPVTFSIPSGSNGGIALTSGGTTTTSLSLITDGSGNATVYYKSGADALKNNTITATAVYNTGGVSVSFTAKCGVQSGLTLWLKADAGVTTSGSNVTNWADQTGTYTLTQSTGSHQPTYISNDINGLPALRLNGSQWLFNSSNMGLNADMTMIVVGTSTTPSNQQYSVWMGNGVHTSRGLGYYSSAQNFNFYNAYDSGAVVPNANTFVVEAGSINSALNSVTFYRNGIQTATGGASGIGAMTPGITVGAALNGSSPWQGDMAEVLVYSHQLNSTELQQVGVYLADKYGIYNPNATWPLAYSSAVQAEINRNQWSKAQADTYVALQSANPTMLTNGLAAWFKADAGVSTSGSNVTSWTDQTGNNTVTQSTSAHQPTLVSNDVNGRPALHFNGSQWLFNARNIGPGLNSDMTMIVMGTSTTPSNQQYSIWMGSGVRTSRGLGYYSSAQNFNFYNAYDSGAAVPNANTFVVEAGSINSALNSVTFYRNGIQTATGGASSIGAVTPGITVGAALNGSSPWQGDIAEVMVYDHQLSSTEFQQVGVYLADRYGFYNPNATWPLAYSSAVQAEINRNQWSKAQADAYVAFQAANPTMLTNGLAAWFKADSGVTQSSGSVSSWADQTGNYTVTQGTSANKPTYVTSDINGKPGLHFSGSQWLFNPTTISPGLNTDMTMITVGMSTAPTNEQYSVWMGNGVHNSRGLGYYSSTQNFNFYNAYDSGAAVPNANTFVVEAGSINSALNSVTFYRNGIQTATGGTSGVGAMAAGITVGAAINGASHPWQGDLAEVLVYDHQLSSTELQQVSVYLADKYGFYYPSATWPSAYSSMVQAEITRNQWSKAQADAYVALQAANSNVPTTGLVFWCKADAGVTYDGSNNVSSWADQTGNYTVTQGTSANKPTYVASDINGKPGLRFSGSQWLFNPSSISPGFNADITTISVAMTTSPSSLQYTLFLGNGSSSKNRGVGYYQSKELFDIGGGYVNVASAPVANAFVTEELSVNSSLNTATFYRNGFQTASTAVGGLLNVTAGITVGAATDQYAPWQGDIAEVLVYDHQLSSTELQQVGIYLANKYNLPTAVCAPVISPAPGSYATAQNITISTPLTGAVITYTTDGTIPTFTSTAYTGAFSLSSNATIKAAVFWTDGTSLGPVASSLYYINSSTSPGVPPTPGSLSVTAGTSGGELDLTWTITGSVTYDMVNVYRSVNGGTYQLVATLDPGTTSYADINVVGTNSYQYKVGTLNEAGEADSSVTSSLAPTSLSSIGITVTNPSSATPVP